MEKLFTVKEASQMTKMSLSWWRMRVFDKDIRFFKIGRRVLIPESTVEGVLKSSVVEPRPDSGFAESSSNPSILEGQ